MYFSDEDCRKIIIGSAIMLLSIVFSVCVLAADSKKQSSPIPMVIQARCEQCAEPFFVPTFRFKVESGTWPEKGILRCKMDNSTVMECENGLKLSVAGITFKTGGE